jgi:peptide-methionine (S)-S-oxide reductase
MEGGSMMSTVLGRAAALGAAMMATAIFSACGTSATADAAAVPRAEVDTALAASSTRATAVFAGGCFWGTQAVFEHVKGVVRVTAGYAGGPATRASYDEVSTGSTGHAESVQVEYDPSLVSYGDLLRVFFSVAHDPTQRNRQGPDVGPQYRSAIFYTTDEQQRVARAYIAQLERAKVFSKPIVTEVTPLAGFYPAEAYHQDYLVHHPDAPYIVINDLPKLEHLKKELPALYRESRTL